MQQRQKWRRESEPMRVPSPGTSRGLRGNAPLLSAFQRSPNYFLLVAFRLLRMELFFRHIGIKLLLQSPRCGPTSVERLADRAVLPPINVPRWRARFQKIC
jgi:hypothetical protein